MHDAARVTCFSVSSWGFNPHEEMLKEMQTIESDFIYLTVIRHGVMMNGFVPEMYNRSPEVLLRTILGNQMAGLLRTSGVKE